MCYNNANTNLFMIIDAIFTANLLSLHITNPKLSDRSKSALKVAWFRVLPQCAVDILELPPI